MWRRVLILALLLCAMRVEAQQLTFYGGETRYDLANLEDGTTWLGGVAFAQAVTRILRADLTVLTFRYEGSAPAEGLRVIGQRVLAEAGFYFQPRAGRMRPYAGAGSGFAVSRGRINQDPWRVRLRETVHVAAGADMGLTASWSMRMEMRVRGIVGPGATHDLTVGLSRRLARRG